TSGRATAPQHGFAQRRVVLDRHTTRIAQSQFAFDRRTQAYAQRVVAGTYTTRLGNLDGERTLAGLDVDLPRDDLLAVGSDHGDIGLRATGPRCLLARLRVQLADDPERALGSAA